MLQTVNEAMKEATAMILQTVIDGDLQFSKLPVHLVVPDCHLMLLTATLVGKIIGPFYPVQVLFEVPIIKALDKTHITVDDWLCK